MEIVAAIAMAAMASGSLGLAAFVCWRSMRDRLDPQLAAALVDMANLARLTVAEGRQVRQPQWIVSPRAMLRKRKPPQPQQPPDDDDGLTPEHEPERVAEFA